MRGNIRGKCECCVALRKESVDRNTVRVYVLIMERVALRKESVDRNLKRSKTMKNRRKSLSARRAWIEIIIVSDNRIFGFVALRKESVDRN